MRWLIIALLLPSSFALNESCNLSVFVSKQAWSVESLSFRLITDYEPINITYWIEDDTGSIVKSKRTTANENTKTYTPNTKGGLLIKATQGSCMAEEAIIIQQALQDDIPEETGEDVLETKKSVVRLDEVSIEDRLITALIRIEKGDTSKRTVRAELRDDSLISSSKLNLPGIHDIIEWTLPLQVPCEKNREVTLSVAGLDDADEEEILLESCEPVRPPSSIQLYAPEQQNITVLGFLHIYNTKPTKETYGITSYTRQDKTPTSTAQTRSVTLLPDTESWVLLTHNPLTEGMHTLQALVNVSWRKTPYRYTTEIAFQPAVPSVRTRVVNVTVNTPHDCNTTIPSITGSVVYEAKPTKIYPFIGLLFLSIGAGGIVWYRRAQR